MTTQPDKTQTAENISAKRWGRFGIVFAIFGISAFILFVLNVALGSVDIPISDTLKIIFGGEEIDDIFGPIIWQLRLPRALSALICGAALAVGGLLLQVFFRNPIVGPYILGISSGSTFMVALVMMGGYILGFGMPNSLTISLAAFIGAMAVMLVIMAVAGKVKSVITLLVIGLMMGYVTSALSQFLVTFAESENVHRFVVWSMGSFSGFTWEEFRLVLIFSIFLLGGSYLIAKPLNAFLLGENYAKSMGVNIRIFRYLVLFLSSGMAAMVTAFAGPVAFIGLAVPHIARLSLGTSDNRILLPAVILAGAMITSLCDLLARMLFAPIELPISATTALFGAPIVIFLLLKRRTSI